MTALEIIDDALATEGLAAQLYVQAAEGGHFAWWHVASEELKRKFREKAKKQISEFRSKTPF